MRLVTYIKRGLHYLGVLHEEYIIAIPYLSSYISRLSTLEPGDLILTGSPKKTPAPGKHIQSGDHVSVEIEKLGELSNPVAAEEVLDA